MPGPLGALVPERINEESEEDVQLPKAGHGRAGDSTGGEGNVEARNNALANLGLALAAEASDGVAIGDHLKLPADSVNQPALSQDNSAPDVKNKYNVIKSLDGNPLSAAWASSERPTDAKGALPAEPVDEGKVRRSEDVVPGAKLTLGDHHGAQDRRAAKPSKPDNTWAATGAPDNAADLTQRAQSHPGASTEPPIMTAEMQDALFEEAMDQIVGNYSIVLNFNS